MYQVKILADSISPEDIRLTTFEVTFPRFLLAELNTHRMLSRNSASSRAIPPERIIAQVRRFPFVPEFNHRVKGMGVGSALSSDDAQLATDAWRGARRDAISAAEELLTLDVDKSRVNRLLEPFMWHTALVTATDWSNFFALRAHPDAQPEFQKLAYMMKDAYETNGAWLCPSDCYHLPLVSLEELGEAPDYPYWKSVAAGRCARISYLTHHGIREPDQDIAQHDRLLISRHLSPFEHTAHPFTAEEWDLIREEQTELRTFFSHHPPALVELMCRQLEYSGNLHGWRSYRSEIANEHDFSLVSAA